MKLQILSPKMHGVLDYATASALIMFPLLLNLGSSSALPLWLSVGTGIAMIAYSLYTDYPCHFSSKIPYDLHLTFDVIAATTFIVAPFAFGFDKVATIFYIVMGALILTVVAISDRLGDASGEDTRPSLSGESPYETTS